MRIGENKELYRMRQQIVEHPYGTIKRQWGFSYIVTKKSIQRASADVGFIMVAYNLRRLMNILGHAQLKNYLREVISLFSAKKGLLKAILAIMGAIKNEYGILFKMMQQKLNKLTLTGIIKMQGSF